VLPNFLYVPVNIPKNNLEALDDFFNFVQDREDIPAVNITQPHKCSPVLRELYLGDASSDMNVDTLIRPHLDIEIVEEAKARGWNTYTGHGMNVRNDYVLRQGIAQQIPGASPTLI
jgi:hypothetical protein